MNVKRMVLSYLTRKGYGGLYRPDSECGCQNSDLFPCDEDSGVAQCLPGYKGPCFDPGERDFWIYKTEQDIVDMRAECVDFPAKEKKI